jgi:hypothetical protein
MTTFTNKHTVPTQNINLINVHEKNKSQQSRLETLQKTSKDIMLKNLQINLRSDNEKRIVRK